MRILAIGLGGAGCRIVNNLYAIDRRGSKVACVQALAIDVNTETLAQLSGLPENAKLFFPPLDPDIQTEELENTQTATIDIREIVSRIHDIDSEETDALFICVGIGGSMVDVAPHLIAALRSSIVEPIFGLVTLPCLAEGERRSAKAADDLDMLSPLLDGIILFDNETWYKKIKAQKSTLGKKEKGLAERLGLSKSEPEVSPHIATYQLLNEAIVRRISLILRAGEFKADGGLDSAEVVLDSGEVLNTMKGMGNITIGYAVERLPQHPLSFLTSWRPTGLFADAHRLKASRIVDLAKQAIYHEISTPCDMTSAHKALILIAGPSHELSLKGYMTVRKWIDRSIAGLETRSGDYPVMNTKNVAIIIMLSGLENIPRITELKEIQKQYKSHLLESDAELYHTESDAISLSGGAGISSGSEGISVTRGKETLKDEILVLPDKSYKKEKSPLSDSERSSYRIEEVTSPDSGTPSRVMPPQDVMRRKIVSEPAAAEKKIAHRPSALPHITEEAIPPRPAEAGDMQKRASAQISRHRIVVTQDHAQQPWQPAAPGEPSIPLVHELTKSKKTPQEAGSKALDEKRILPAKHEQVKTKEMERKIIEKELQRQRMKAISGRTLKTAPPESGGATHPTQAPKIIRLKRQVTEKTYLNREPEPSVLSEISEKAPENRTVIIQKKKTHTKKGDMHSSEEKNNEDIADEDTSVIMRPDAGFNKAGSEESKVDVKNSEYPSRAEIFKKKSLQKTNTPLVRNSALIHTDLKSKKIHGESKNTGDETGAVEETTESLQSPHKKEKRTTKKDDISWI